jgi:hypothetical protein
MLVVAISLIGVGGLARDAGFSVEIAVASTLLIWAGPAQVLFFGAVAAKASWAVIALSISISSVRNIGSNDTTIGTKRTDEIEIESAITAQDALAATAPKNRT